MAFEDDLDVFLDEFSTSAALDSGRTITVIFDGDYLAALGVVESTGPMALAKTSDVEANEIVQGSRIVIESVEYVVAKSAPDGTGMTLLQLHKDC